MGIGVVLLAGCAGQKFFLEGKQYNSKDEFIAARESTRSSCLASVTPLPQPIVNRKLVMMIPTQETIYKNRYAIIKAANPGYPVTMDGLRNNVLIAGLGESYRQNFEQVKKRNMYASVELVEYESLSEPQPTSNTDVYFIRLAEGLGARDTIYLVTSKNGRQIVNVDASSVLCSKRIESLLASLQTLALQ
jgi:hypothetical protein